MFNKSFKTPLDVALARSGDKKLITLLQQQNNQIDIQAERGSMDYRSRESCASGYDNGSDDDSDQGSRAKKRKTEKGKEQKKKVNKNAAQGKLMSALEAGSLSEKTLKKWIVSKAVDLNAFKKSSHRDAPLCLAVRSGRVSLVKLLLKHNADVNFRGQNYYPIHIAAMHKQQTIFNSLIEHKVRHGCE